MSRDGTEDRWSRGRGSRKTCPGFGRCLRRLPMEAGTVEETGGTARFTRSRCGHRCREPRSPRWGLARRPFRKGRCPRNNDDYDSSLVVHRGRRWLSPRMTSQGSLATISPRTDQEPAHRVPRDDTMGRLDVRPQELLEEVPLRRTRFPVVVRDGVHRAVVLQELERVLAGAREFRHVPALVPDLDKPFHPRPEVSAPQIIPMSLVQLLGPLLQEV